MNLRKLILATVPAFMLAACSEDALDGGKGGKEVFNGDGFVALTINLPTQTGGSRANDNFDDGTPNEYAMRSAALVLFKGTSEATATFESAYDMSGGNLPTPDPDNGNITTTYVKSQKVKDVKLIEGEKLYALVMLNYGSVMTIVDGGATIGSTSLVAGETTFDDVQGMTSDHKLYTGEGKNATFFFMANSPLADKPGGEEGVADVKTTTLVEVTDCLYPTQAEAEANAANSASVFVERGVAKATLNVNDNVEVPEGLTLEVVGWALGNTEPSSYVVRNLGKTVPDNEYAEPAYLSYMTPLYQTKVNDSNPYRFIGTKKMKNANPEIKKYRPYWCVDPNYTQDKPEPNKIDLNGDAYYTKDTPLYCHENTFDLDHQDYKNTTRAVLKVKFKDDKGVADEDGTFYMLNDNESLIVSKKTAESHARKYILEDEDFKEDFRKCLHDGKELVGDAESEVNDNYFKYVTITFVRNASTGLHEVTDIKYENVNPSSNPGESSYKEQPVLDEKQKTAMIVKVNSMYRISAYKNGEVYYDVRFQHFGDDQTPLPDDFVSTENAESTYKGLVNNYLGRWGMVRNNWYDITVTAFKRIGSPVAPDVDVETPDDNQRDEKWVAFKVNILSWAKRTQTTEF